MNKFLCVAQLQELRIDIYQTHMKAKFSVITNNQCLTMSQTLSRKWNEAQIKSWLAMAQYIHPRIDSYIYVKNKHYYTMKKSDTPTRLLVSGNINEWKKSLYYNVQYCRIERDNAPCGLNIEIDGQWIDNERLVNLSGEWARLFHIAAPSGYEKRLYRLRLDYCSGAIVDGDKVKLAPYGLQAIDCKPLDEYIDDEQMKNIMLELEILNEGS